MSLSFNDTTTRKGIIQGIEKECGYNYGEISGNASRLLEFTADVNESMDEALSIILQADGKCRFDDSNHDDYNVIYFDIAAGQQDYSFVNDESGNLILTFDKVYRKPSATGLYEEIDPVDPVTEIAYHESIDNGQGVTGIPSQYDKTGNGIIFDVIPDYDAPDGGMIYISREASYFTAADTTKKPGFSGLYHRWCVVCPSLKYARINLSPDRIASLQNEKNQLIADLKAWYGTKTRDEKPMFKPRITPFR